MSVFLFVLWIITVGNLVAVWKKNGQPKNDYYNFRSVMIGIAIDTALLFGAGFWHQPLFLPKAMIIAVFIDRAIVHAVRNGKTMEGEYNFLLYTFVFVFICVTFSVPLMIWYGWI